MLNPLRHQLPTHSPLPLGAMVRWGLSPGTGAGTGEEDMLRALEEVVKTRYAAEQVHLLGSGTEALTVALATARTLDSARRGGTPPRPIAVPAFSCYDILTAAQGAGTPLVYYDVDPDTLGPDPASLESAMGEGVAGVVVASLFGFAPHWDTIAALPGGDDTVIIEDAAQGFGGSWRGAPLGSGGGRNPLATLSVLSFGRGKGWTAGSGGGALLVRSGEEGIPTVKGVPSPPAAGGSRRTRSRLTSLGKALLLWGLARPGLYRLPRSIPWLGLGQTRLKAPGPPSLLPDAVAGLLLQTLAASERAATVRRETGRAYAAALEGSAAEIPYPPAESSPGYLRFPLLLEGGLEGLTDPARGLRLGAEASYPRILPEVGRALGLVDEGPREWTGARRLVQSLITFPTHERTRASERAELVGLVKR